MWERLTDLGNSALDALSDFGSSLLDVLIPALQLTLGILLGLVGCAFALAVLVFFIYLIIIGEGWWNILVFPVGLFLDILIWVGLATFVENYW